MASTLTLVLVGLGLYTLAMLALKSRGVLPDSLRVTGPIVTVHTQRGKALLDRLARRRRFWRAWGNMGLGIALVVMVFSAIFFLWSALTILAAPERARSVDPQNALVIPGVNDFLPLSAAPDIIFGLLLGMVVHEGGHGLLCRVEDIDIDSMGVALLAFIPIGAFVEPDEESRQAADRGSQSRMFAAGVTNNFAVTAIAFALLFGPVAGSLAVAAGVPVGGTFPESAAAEAGLGDGDVITSINGTTVENQTELEAALDDVDSSTVAVGLKDGSTVAVTRQLLVTSAVPEPLAGVNLDGDPPVLREVNGTSVATDADIAAAVQNRTVATLNTTTGTATLPIGAYVNRVTEDGPLAAAGAPTDRYLIVTAVDGTRVYNGTDYRSTLANISANTETTVVAYVDGNRTTFNVTTAAGEGGSRLGVSGLAAGYSGLVLDDFGIKEFPAGLFLSVLDGTTPAVQGQSNPFAAALIQVGLVLFLPIFSLAGASFNFAGFTGGITDFYVVQGPLGILGGGVFLLANLLFWTGWVNLNLALFNCIPAFPLDGGHMLRTSTETIVSRLPIPRRRTLVSAVTTVVSLTMLAALLFMFFGPQLLG